MDGVASSSDAQSTSPYRHIWVGLQGKRTVGQLEGRTYDGDICLANTSSVGGTRCYGWALHNKPMYTPENHMITSLTVIVHLDNGKASRIVWDDGCSMCPSDDELDCKQDNTSNVCYSGGSAVACTDCYASLGNTCGSGSISCTPRVHVAWKGTDRLGRPLSSAGSILSQFRSNALSGLAGQLYKQIEDINNEELAKQEAAEEEEAAAEEGSEDVAS